MSCHDEFQIEIPAYIASRMASDASRIMEEHLRGCDECREIASAWKAIVPALREGGEALFEEHPLEMTLRDHARGESRHDGAVARHVDRCASCELEVRFWASRHEPAEVRVRAALTPSGWRPPHAIWSAAAGLVAGAAMAYFVLASGLHSDAGRRAAWAPPEIAALSGRAPQVVLPRTVRGDGVERHVSLGAADRSLIIAAQIDLPEDPGDAGRYRFDLRDGDGTSVWSTELDSGTMRADAEANEVISFVVPAGSLAAGRYTFAGGPDAATGGFDSSYRATIVVSRAEN